MSGGVGGSVGLLGFGAAAVVVGGAMITAQITKAGSIAVYEQIQLAKECTEAVRKAKEARRETMNSFTLDSERTLSLINESTRAEILRLKHSLENRGQRVNLSNLGNSDEEILISLLTMNRRLSGKSGVSTFRSPKEVFRSIAEAVDPLFLYIPETDPVYKTLNGYKAEATEIVSDSSIPMEERAQKLRAIEHALISQLDTYRLIARKYEYQFVQFTTLSHAFKRLAEACSDVPVAQRRYDPQKAEEQIMTLRAEIEKMKKTLKEKLLLDPQFIAENKHLTEVVNRAVSDAGYKRLSTQEKPYGTTSLYAFYHSLLKVTVSKEGMLSMDLVGRKGESKQQIYADEKAFCTRGISEITSKFQELGLVYQQNQTVNLTEDSILYEDALLTDEYQDQRAYEENPRLMYADGERGVMRR